MEKRNRKLFYGYLIVGLVFAIMLEISNSGSNQPAGLGVIFFCCMEILYYTILPHKQEATKHSS